VFQKLTVEQNVLAILETRKLSRAERFERLEELLDELSIAHLRKNKAYSLSGGERRRLEITRALATRPKFLLLDEPFTGVDPIAIDDIQRIVRDLRDKGLGVLITDHNVRETLSITDRAYLLFEGKILVEGEAHHLVNDPEARELYLGQDFQL
jgi:lipopolysaccharide export system ATP-binding protein